MAFVKAQFMEPPGSGTGATPIGAVKAGPGVSIAPDGTISSTASGGTISNIVPSNGIQGGGTGPTVFLGLLPPQGTSLGGVRTIDGSGISIDSDGVIRSVVNVQITGGPGINVADLGGDAYSISALAATNSVLGSIIVPASASSGLSLAPSGALTLRPASSLFIGGVKPGVGCTVAPDGTLNATGSGGTITGVGVGTGLGGGGTTGAVTLFLQPAGTGAANNIGGVYAGDNVTIAADGRISATTTGVQSITATPGGSINITGTPTNPSIGVVSASTTVAGSVQLVDSTSSSQVDGFAATPNSVKIVADAVATKLPIGGGTMTGSIDFVAGQSFPGVIPESSFTQLGGILVGSSSAPGYGQLTVGTDGQVLAANSLAPLGVQWVSAGSGTVSSVTGTAPVQVATGTTTPVISVDAASTTAAGIVQLFDGVGSTSTTTAATPNSVRQAYDLAALQLPLSGGTMTGNITFTGTQTFPGTLPLAGGTMTGDIVFNAGQTFTGTLPLSGGTMTGAITFAAGQTFTGTLPLAGGTMTGAITFAAGQTFPGTISATLLDVTGDIVFASAANTPASLPIGTAGSILAVNAGLPAWRTAAQLGLLTSAAAATTYAPLNSPTFTGPATVNAGGSGGSNALIVSGGSLVLSTTFTPGSSTDTGSTGEISWDANYLYICTAPNTWGRIAIDSTPF